VKNHDGRKRNHDSYTEKPYYMKFNAPLADFSPMLRLYPFVLVEDGRKEDTHLTSV